MENIFKGKVRILHPLEYESLLNAIPKDKHQIIIKTLLFTGMRFVEIQRLKQHPEWLSKEGNVIHLPDTAVKKAKRKQKDRYVKLNPLGKKLVRQFLNGVKLPTKQTLNKNLQRWGIKAKIGDEGICIKTFRKTWESWLISHYTENVFQICLSQGHTTFTSLNHYANLPFTSGDRERMKQYVEGIEW